MSRKKICLLLPTFQAGGMERVMAQLAHYFCETHSDEVHMILYGRNIQFYYEMPQTLIMHTPDFNFNNRFRFWGLLRRLWFVRRTVRGICPDKVLSFGEYWNSFVLLALWGLNYPVYVSDRCQPGKKMRWLHRLLRRMLYPGATGIVAQTSIARDIYSRQLRHPNIRVIANPVRIPDFLNGQMKENVVLTVGRLIKTKNHQRLIELFVSVNKPGWKLIIVGGDAQRGHLSKDLELQIQQLQASDRVVLAGNQPEVERFYRMARIFAFTSESEGFPNVLAEAMAFGLPVVSFDCTAGPSDMIIDNYNGFLVPLNDYSIFKERLAQLMDSDDLRTRLGNHARESMGRFGVEKVGRAFYDFISEK